MKVSSNKLIYFLFSAFSNGMKKFHIKILKIWNRRLHILINICKQNFKLYQIIKKQIFLNAQIK